MERLGSAFRTIERSEAYQGQVAERALAERQQAQTLANRLRPSLESGQIPQDLLKEVVNRNRANVISQIYFGGGSIDLAAATPAGASGFGGDNVFTRGTLEDIFPTERIISQISLAQTAREGINFLNPEQGSQFIREFAQQQIKSLESQSFRFSQAEVAERFPETKHCLLYTSPSPRDRQKSRMPSSA